MRCSEYQQWLDIFKKNKRNIRMDREMLIMQFACSFFVYESVTRPLNCTETIAGLSAYIVMYTFIHSSFGTNFMTGQARELHFCEH